MIWPFLALAYLRGGNINANLAKLVLLLEIDVVSKPVKRLRLRYGTHLGRWLARSFRKIELEVGRARCWEGSGCEGNRRVIYWRPVLVEARNERRTGLFMAVVDRKKRMEVHGETRPCAWPLLWRREDA